MAKKKTVIVSSPKKMRYWRLTMVYADEAKARKAQSLVGGIVDTIVATVTESKPTARAASRRKGKER